MIDKFFFRDCITQKFYAQADKEQYFENQLSQIFCLTISKVNNRQSLFRTKFPAKYKIIREAGIDHLGNGKVLIAKVYMLETRHASKAIC